MSLETTVMMICVMALVWGGFAVTLVAMLRQESRNKNNEEGELDGDGDA